MPNIPLKSYLRMYRRKTGLTQDDVVYLLGRVDGTTVSRHERGVRIPILEVLLAYQIILGVPVADLFEGELHRVAAGIHMRAEGLVRFLEQGMPREDTQRRVAYVKNLYQPPDDGAVTNPRQ